MGEVKIYFWETPFKEGGVGHVSLKTFHDDNSKGIYASFWPLIGGEKYKDHKENRYTLKKSIDGKSYLRTWEYDKEFKYNRPPKTTISINNLDVREIEKSFNEFKETDFRWEASGSSIFAAQQNQNCAGLVFYLLQKGGIYTSLGIFTRWKIRLKEWAPPSWEVAIVASPFAFFGGYSLKRKVEQARMAIAVKEIDVLSTLSWFDNNITSEREGIAKKFIEKYSADIVKYFAGNLGWVLSVVDDFSGNFGLAISISITALAVGYISAVGLGSTASFAVVTPDNVVNISREVGVEEPQNEESLIVLKSVKVQ